jgi:hypothetical protein
MTPKHSRTVDARPGVDLAETSSRFVCARLQVAAQATTPQYLRIRQFGRWRDPTTREASPPVRD